MDFASRTARIPGTLPTLNLPMKIHPSSEGSFPHEKANRY